MLGEHGHTVGPDLVGGIAVGGDAVRSDDDGVDLALRHQARCHVVADQRCGDADARQLPRRQARALPHRARLIGVDALDLALSGGRVDNAERRSVQHGPQTAGVAVGEHLRPGAEQFGAVCADRTVRCDVLVLHAEDLLDHGIGDLPRRP